MVAPSTSKRVTREMDAVVDAASPPAGAFRRAVARRVFERVEQDEAAPMFAPTEVDTVFGSLPTAGKAKTVAEMNESVASEARRRARDT